ncbi:ABC transporter substrate-binding protein, partial [Sporichthya sp.]|uniref:ABC transporter substrate-binding protein n=1 Tax=Sporichthya sp. TaxID=65475 RepID=UPI0017E0401D
AAPPASAAGKGKPGAAKPGAAVAGTASSPCTQQGAPLILGQNGTFSGLVGASIGANRIGLAIWQKAVNAAGGIQCHPIQIFQVDDGASPAQAASNVSDLIYNKKAVAILDAAVPLTLDAVRSVINKANVPVVGGDISDPGWFEDPLLFPQGTGPIEGFTGGIALGNKLKGFTKLGILYCVEAAICATIHKEEERMAANSNTTLAYSQSISLTQSSYTSECQNAKNAGVQIIYMGADGSALTRLASSCASLGYFPGLSGPGIAISPALSKSEALKKAGVYLGTIAAPFNTSDNPGTAEWTEAVKKYASGQPVDQSASNAWAAGKMLQAALNAVGPSLRERAITTQDIFDGLYKLKNETLGGLVPPRTFVKGELPKRVGCYWGLILDGNGFSAPYGGRRLGTC